MYRGERQYVNANTENSGDVLHCLTSCPLMNSPESRWNGLEATSSNVEDGEAVLRMII